MVDWPGLLGGEALCVKAYGISRQSKIKLFIHFPVLLIIGKYISRIMNAKKLAPHLILGVTLVGLLACARNPVTGKREISLMSTEQEIAIGKESHPSVVATMGLYDDKKLTGFINEKGKAMAKISHRPDLPYQFYIVDSPVVNAFAVPGGYVYFTRGIMAHFNNEAEFAGVLGHEIGHITAKPLPARKKVNC
jgi:predicted Zn-dependent protease